MMKNNFLVFCILNINIKNSYKIIMENLTSEEIVVLGTLIALELSKNKSLKELYTIKKLILQIFNCLLQLIK